MFFPLGYWLIQWLSSFFCKSFPTRINKWNETKDMKILQPFCLCSNLNWTLKMDPALSPSLDAFILLAPCIFCSWFGLRYHGFTRAPSPSAVILNYWSSTWQEEEEEESSITYFNNWWNWLVWVSFAVGACLEEQKALPSQLFTRQLCFIAAQV